jgi:PAS domain S-box-containing protein
MRSSEPRPTQPLPLPAEAIDHAFLRLAVGLMLAGSLGFIAVVIAVAPGQMVRALGGVLLGAIALIAAFLLHRERHVAAIRTLAYGMWGVVSFMAVLGGGLHAPIVIAYPVLVAMGGWLLGPPTATVLAGLTLAWLGLLFAGGALGGLPAIGPAPLGIVWAVDAIVLVSAAALTIYATRGHRALYRRQGQLAADALAKADALAEGEARLRLVTESVPALIAHYDSNHVCHYANRRYAAFFGFTQDEIVGRSLTEVVGGTVFAAIQPQLNQVLAGEAVRYSGTRQSPKQGGRHMEVSLVPQREANGRVAGYLVMILDVTEQHQAEQAIRLSETKFAKIFRSSPVPISLARFGDGRFVDVNPAFESLFGWAREEVIGRTSTEVGVWKSREERERWTQTLRAAGKTRSFEVDWRNRAGQDRICQISAEIIQIEGEDHILALTYDITERKAAESALRESEARLREAQRIGHFGSWELDLEKDAFYWSGEIDHIFETTAPQGKVNYAAFLQTIHPEDRTVFDQAFRQAIAAGATAEFNYRLCMPDGRIKHVHARAELRLGEDGRPIRSIGTTQDITEHMLALKEIERLNAELEKRVQERTADLSSANRELESFAYSISHDLRAPLRGIDGFSQLLIEEYADKLDKQGADYLSRVRRAAQRMGTLIDDILELSRVSRLEMRRVTVDLSQIAGELIEERARSEPGHRVAVSLAPECKALGDPQLLRVMMQNLLENAWKYSSKEAAPAIEFGCRQEGPEQVFFVRDNGVGFDMKYADRLFTPFQRLHKPEEFEGTGIGLATVARVVHRHGGRVWAQAEPGRGATISFTLSRGKTGD